MDRFHQMAVYLAVAEEASFAAGARRMGMSPPAVTRAISSLEKRLGIKLLTRTTRFVRTTDAGLRYLEHARRVLAAADEADEYAAGANAIPRGRLAVTTPVLFGRMFVMPSILEYLRRYPDMHVSVLLLDRLVNLIEEGMDVGIRIGELPDSTMKAIEIGHVRRVVCASPAYLKANGTPRVPSDLSDCSVIAASPVSASVDWQFKSGKKTIGVKVKPRLTVTNNEAAIVAAVEGFGVTRLLSYQIAPYLVSGQLNVVLADYEPTRLPIHILHLESRNVSGKVRTFVDLLVEQLRNNVALR